MNIQEQNTITAEAGQHVFDFDGHSVRVVEINGEPWFVARDIGNFLELTPSAVSKVTSKLPDLYVGLTPIHTSNGVRESTIIAYEGVVKMIIKSRKPKAEEFQDWLSFEVVPSIRKRGFYQVDSGETELELLLESSERAVATLKKMVEQERKLLSHDRKLQAHESIVNDHEGRIELIENTARANARRLMEVERSDEPVKEKTVRSKLNQIVRAYCLAKQVGYQETWTFLYTEFKYRYHKDIPGRWGRKLRKLERARANSGGKKVKFDKLDMADEMGCLDDLYALASLLFAVN